MTTTAVETLRADRAALLEIGAGTLVITVDGPGSRVIQLGQGEPVARISSDAPAFVRWVTQRGSWAELGVQATGDEAQLAIARSLHVF